MIGEVISDKYKIVAPFSESHMYEVFKALEIATGAAVVIKILKEEMAVNTERVKNFSEEIRSFASFSHPLIAEILDIDMFDDRPYVVTELVDGTDLHTWIRGETLPFAEAVKIMQDLATVLQFASDQTILNRTIKLSNVLRNKDGKLKVLAFTHPRLKLAGRVRTTENIGVHSDLFFLGTTFFELLAGESPIRKRGGINELWDMKLAAQMRIRHSALTPEQIDKVVKLVRKTLTRDMKNRFESHEEFLKAVADLSGSIRGSSIRKKSQQLSMASQVVDALNGRMSNVNTAGSVKAEKVLEAGMPVSNSLKQESNLNDAVEVGSASVFEGNLALATEVQADESGEMKFSHQKVRRPELKVLKFPERTAASSKEMWSDTEEKHWLRNPVLFMGSCLFVMLFLIFFW